MVVPAISGLVTRAAIPAMGGAFATDKGKRFLSGFTDFLTGGMTDLDQKGDNRMQQFQKNQLDRNIMAAKGFADFATGGMTDFDQRGDSRLQQFQKNQMRRNIEGAKSFGDYLTGGLTDFDQKGDSGLQQFGKKATGVVGQAMLGGAGSLAKNAMDLVGINGTQRMDTGETSQGAQELAQKVEQNEKTGIMQRVADFLNRGPFPGSPDDPRTPSGSKLIKGPDGEMYDENFIKTIPGGFENMQEIERRRKIFEGMP